MASVEDLTPVWALEEEVPVAGLRELEDVVVPAPTSWLAGGVLVEVASTCDVELSIVEVSDDDKERFVDAAELVLLGLVSRVVDDNVVLVSLVRNGVTFVVELLSTELVVDNSDDEVGDEVVVSTGIIVNTSESVVLVVCDVVFENSTLLAPLSQS